jgi:hypothetical protein
MLEGKGEIGGSVKVEEIECGMKTWAETIQGRIESASFGIVWSTGAFGRELKSRLAEGVGDVCLRLFRMTVS